MAAIPQRLTLLPLRNSVVFPYVTIPLSVGREKTIAAIEEASVRGNLLAIVAQRDGFKDDPRPEDLYTIGVVCKISKVQQVGDGSLNVTVYGLQRFRVRGFVKTNPYIEVDIELVDDRDPDDPIALEQARELKDRLHRYLTLAESAPQEIRFLVDQVESPGMLCDQSVYHLRTDIAKKQEVLELIDVRLRLSVVLEFLAGELEVLEMSKRIRAEMKSRFDQSQRELLLREQLKAIKKELGEADEKDEEILELQKAVRKARMPEHAEKAAGKELERLSRSSPMSAEYGMLRTYLEWLVELPWSRTTEDNLDLANAARVLDEDHYGLEKIKKRILEFLAVRRLTPQSRGPILCFLGPPGVGKTSLGRSIARAMDRRFTRVSLGGVHDEAEIRGHRRTYVGALPGRLLQGIKKGGALNPVFMLDEIDKMGRDFRGDPASAMLEVLDPEQNHTFQDHYLGMPFDLSRVFFICTANRLDTVSPALQDRMEIVEIPGYSEEEKFTIARRFLVGRELEANGLTPEHLEITDAALRTIIADYTREAGVRGLQRQIGAVCRRVARDVALGAQARAVIGPEPLREILGPLRHFHEIAEAQPLSGVATGLVWTPVGGDILFVEVSRLKGKGELILTGSLGEVMKESAQTALSFLKSRAAEYHIDPEELTASNIHIHMPAGAIPKDGPSAGITLLAAMLSLFARREVDPALAMTGEITLRGALMPVGGVKEKLLAARRAGIRRVLLPRLNEKDAVEIPAEVRGALELRYFDGMGEALHAVFGDFGQPAAPPPPIM